MSVFPSPRLEPLVTITPFSLESLGSASVADGISIDAGVSSAWPSNNYAIFYPFSLSRRITVQSLFCMNGATAAGNIDMGIYTMDGTRIVSAGSTAQSGTNAIQALTITPTQLSPGFYYLAIAASSTSTTIFGHSVYSNIYERFMGTAGMASAFPLPATATLASGGNLMFLIALTTRSVV